MLTKCSRFATSLVLLLLACACSTSNQPLPQVGPPTAPDRFGAPVAERPLDVSDFLQRPCASLTGVNLETLGLDAPGQEREVVDGRTCRWKSREFDDLSIAFDGERDLLVLAYRNRDGSVFLPTTVLGYPAARQKIDRGQFNSCTVTTGLGPRQALTVDWVGSIEAGADRDACELAQQASVLVVQKLRPAP